MARSVATVPATRTHGPDPPPDATLDDAHPTEVPAVRTAGGGSSASPGPRATWARAARPCRRRPRRRGPQLLAAGVAQPAVRIDGAGRRADRDADRRHRACLRRGAARRRPRAAGPDP